MYLRPILGTALAVALAATAVQAQSLQELFSRHVQILNPRGGFAGELIRIQPAAGNGWREIKDERFGYRLQVPTNAEVETEQKDSRVLLVTLPPDNKGQRGVFRIDSFEPQPGEPTVVDQEYAEAYAEQYPEAAFAGKFEVTESGLVILPKKVPFAMVGGSHPQGNDRGFRLQWVHLSPKRQYFLTFDCAHENWPVHTEQVGRMLLSFTLQK